MSEENKIPNDSQEEKTKEIHENGAKGDKGDQVIISPGSGGSGGTGGFVGTTSINLKLNIDGNDVEGESTVSSMERENTIEILEFHSGVDTPMDQASGSLTGRRMHEPVTVVKMVDKSTPLLFKALAMNEPVTSAEFMFFGPDASGGGAEVKFLTITIENAYVASHHLDADLDGNMYETVSFVFQDITITYESTGATHTDRWSGES